MAMFPSAAGRAEGFNPFAIPKPRCQAALEDVPAGKPIGQLVGIVRAAPQYPLLRQAGIGWIEGDVIVASAYKPEPVTVQQAYQLAERSAVEAHALGITKDNLRPK